MQIKEETFTQHKDAVDLLRRLREALEALSGHPRAGKYAVPRKLLPLTRPAPGGEPGRLLPSYAQIWNSCFIVFDPNERGASIHMPTGKIRFGPFFVSGWTRKDLEKVILHEYLHKAIAMQPDFGGVQFRKDAQHGEIDQIIEFELKYKGHPRGNRQLD
jgi:hypothetical protein